MEIFLVAAIVLLLAFGAGKKKPAGAPESHDGGAGGDKPKIPQAVPLPLPPPSPGPGPADVPVDLSGEGAVVEVSPDCKTVIVDWQRWGPLVAAEAEAHTADGRGSPVYPYDRPDIGLDAVLRTIVHGEAPACIESAPWLDRYAQQNPLPDPGNFTTWEAYKSALEAWDAAWDAKFSTWAKNHPQMYDWLRKTGAIVVKAYLGQYQPTGPGTVVENVPQLKPADRSALLELGYTIAPGVVGSFQQDWNAVGVFRFGPAFASTVALDEDGVIGPRTREAIVSALEIHKGRMPWPSLVETAYVEGP